jgi:hypothetical protein
MKYQIQHLKYLSKGETGKKEDPRMSLSDNIHAHILKYKGFCNKCNKIGKLSMKWTHLALEYIVPFINARRE